MPTEPEIHSFRPAFCQLCGQSAGESSQLLHHPRWAADQALRVCENCYAKNPRCRICGISLSTSTMETVCPTCQSYIPVCVSCGKPIIGRYAERKGNGPYCINCYRNNQACDICGLLIREQVQRWQLSDGRISCEACHATAVYEMSEARSVYDEVIRTVSETLDIQLNVPTGLVLVDQNQIADIIRKHDPDGLHNPATTLGVYARNGMRRGIYIQTGLPRQLVLQVAAHEYGHAWQGENCPLLRNPLAREGFAEWVAYKTLQAASYEHQMGLMKTRADLYGQGLQWALDIEARKGVAGLKEYCRKIR